MIHLAFFPHSFLFNSYFFSLGAPPPPPPPIQASSISSPVLPKYLNLISVMLGSNIEAAGTLDVKHESEMCMTFRNLSKRPFYLAMFDLGPSWQINSLLCSSGGGEFMVVPPKNDIKGLSDRAEIRWRMNVPESFRNPGQCQCTDILKIFLTGSGTSITRCRARSSRSFLAITPGSFSAKDRFLKG